MKMPIRRFFTFITLCLLVNSIAWGNSGHSIFSQDIQNPGQRSYGAKIDSLVLLLPSLPEGRTRVDVLNEISKQMLWLNGPLANSYAELAIELGNKIDYFDGVTVAMYNDGTAYWAQGYYDSAFSRLFPALEYFKKNNHQSKEAEALNRIGLVYYYQSLYDKAIEFIGNSVEQYTELGDTINLARVTNNLGLVYDKTGNLEISFNLLLRALKLNESATSLRDQQSSPVFNVGPLHKNKYFNDKALDFHNEQLKKYLQEKDTINIVNTIKDIGDLHVYQNRFDKALEIYYQQYDILKNSTRFILMAKCLEDLGRTYGKLGDYQKSIDYLSKALVLVKKYSSKIWVSGLLEYLAESLKDAGDFAEAEYYLGADIELSREMGNQLSMAQSLLRLARVNLLQNKYEKAKSNALKAQIIAEKIEAKFIIQESVLILSKIYETIKDYKQAYDNYLTYNQLTSDIFNEKSAKQISYLQVKYETEKKESEISNLNLQNQRQEKILAQRSQIMWLMGLGIFLALLTLFLILNRYFIVQKLNDEKAILLGEIHHRVKNNLQMVSSLLSLQGRKLDDEKAKKVIDDSRNRVKSMGLIHNFLYKENAFAQIDLQEYVKELTEMLISSYIKGRKKINLKLNIGHIKPDIDTAIPLGLIINELVTNSLKHAFKEISNPELFIGIKEENKRLILKVEDNGNTGTDFEHEQSSSFGWRLIRSLTEKLGGSIETQLTDGFRVKALFSKYKLVSG